MSSSSLKRSQKLCPQCKEKNPIRSFKCKKCSFDFPQKEKKTNQLSQKNTLEQYLARKTYRDEDVPVSTPIPKKQNTITDILNIQNFTEKSLIYETSLNFEFISNSDNNSNVIIIRDNDKQIKIKFPSISFCTTYSFDCVNAFKTIYASTLFLSDNNSLYLSLISLEELTSKCSLLYQYKPSSSEEDKFYFSIISKIVQSQKNPGCFFIVCIVDNILYCLLPSISKHPQNEVKDNEIKSVFTINKNYPISKVDAVYDDTSKSIKLIMSDCNNQIFFYVFTENKDKKAKLLGVYENHFQNKITDIKYLINGAISYFAACSRDGILKIIDSNNTIVLKHKTYQTWITQIAFDSLHDIIYFLANFDDKVVGVKLNPKREPIIKRLADTNNPYYIQVSEIGDKIYYLDSKGKYWALTTMIIEDLFKKKGRREGSGPTMIYEIPNEDKDIFMNKIIFLNLYDKNGFSPVLISQYRNYILYKHVN